MSEFLHKTRSHGFTLLEVLLVILLLGLLLAGAYGSIRAAARAIHAGEQTIERTNRLRAAQEFIRHQISRALPLSFGQEQASGNNFLFQGERDFMRFVAPMPGYLSHGGAYVQTLELANGRDGMQLLFTNQMLNGFDLQKLAGSDLEPEPLLDQIRSGHFEFRSFDAEGKLGEWKDKWDESNQLPLMVRIELTMQDSSRLVWPSMEIPLLLDMGGMQRPFGGGGGFIPQPPMPMPPRGTP